MEKHAAVKGRAHVLLVAYPAQGHLNPMLQFGKRLASKGVKCTLVTTVFLSKTTHFDSAASSSIEIDTISDGFDDTGLFGAKDIETADDIFKTVSSKTLSELITRRSATSNPVTCVVYDSLTPWMLDVTKKHGLIGAPFSTTGCAYNNVASYAYHGYWLPLLDNEDMPSYLRLPALYLPHLKAALEQYSNLDRADFMFVNTIYELEEKVVNSISTPCPLLTIGPTIPSVYLDNRVEGDKFYGVNLFNPDYEVTSKWLEDKPSGSVVYVSFGSRCSLAEEQMMELAWALKVSTCYYLWVINASLQTKLPKDIFTEIGEKGIILNWSPQLEVLANKAVGCFLTHCGWNSTLEGLCLGVPMVAMPQYGDQMINARLIQDIWKVGVKVNCVEEGIVKGQEIVTRIMEVMHGERAEEMSSNAKRLSSLAKAAISEGGSSDKNINKFVNHLANFS
ncbi:hypothetical protein Ancab_008722 [Ancistrocladus abbreviatus]